MFTGCTTLEGIDSDVIRRMYVDGNSRRSPRLVRPTKQLLHVLKDGSASAMDSSTRSAATSSASTNRTLTASSHGMPNKPRCCTPSKIRTSTSTICGVAGTGKTLLALAGALEQKNRYDQIILARPIVALSNKDGLPGDAEEKVNLMQPLYDNLNFISSLGLTMEVSGD